MGKITAILQAAQQRARDAGLPYEGALLPGEAYEILQSAPGARLVDVRSRAELDWVGRIPGAAEIEWMSYPGMKLNPGFMAQLEQEVDKEALVMFICRSGARRMLPQRRRRRPAIATATTCCRGLKATGMQKGIATALRAGAWRVCPGFRGETALNPP